MKQRDGERNPFSVRKTYRSCYPNAKVRGVASRFRRFLPVVSIVSRGRGRIEGCGELASQA